MQIKIVSFGFPLREVADFLKLHSERDSLGWDIVALSGNYDRLAISNEAVALIVAGLNTLGVFINALVLYLKEKGNGTITIKGDHGEIVIPKDTPFEKILTYVKIAQDLGKIDHVDIKK